MSCHYCHEEAVEGLHLCPKHCELALSTLGQECTEKDENIAALEGTLHDIESASVADAVQEAAAFRERAEVAEKALCERNSRIARLVMEVSRLNRGIGRRDCRSSVMSDALKECLEWVNGFKSKTRGVVDIDLRERIIAARRGTTS